MVGKSGGNNPGKQYAEAQLKAKEFQQFITSNKFEYGHDPNGGSRAAGKAGSLANSVNYKFDPKQMQSNKLKAENQNFKIQPNRALQNSETKRIGDKIDSFQKNEIDLNSLKRSHVPFANIKSALSGGANPDVNFQSVITTGTPNKSSGLGMISPTATGAMFSPKQAKNL